MNEYTVWFTSQEGQTLAFVNAFRQETESLTQVAGLDSTGKTWLVQRLGHACSILDLPYAFLDFGDGRPRGYLGIVRQVRDQMGAAHFNLLTRVLNKIGTGVLPLLDDVDHLHPQDVRAARGRSAIERDDYAFVRARKKSKQKVLEARVTRAFYTCLEALSQKKPVVFAFDSYEQVTKTTDRWLCDNLMAWTSEGQLPRSIILVTGRGKQPVASLRRGRRMLKDR